MERADHANIQTGGLLQDRLDLLAVLAHDVGIVPTGIIQPVFFKIHLVSKQVAAQSAEGAKGIGGE